MAAEPKLREMIVATLNKARTKIRSYAGLHESDALVSEVLAACDEVLQWIDIKEDFNEARRAVQIACQQLATAATERRSHEGGAISASAETRPWRRSISSRLGCSRGVRRA